MSLNRVSIATILMCAIALPMASQQQDLPTNGSPSSEMPTRSAPPRVALVLGGGGALGLTELGVLRWLEENHIPIDVIGGTSMGCMLSAFYATGHSPDEIDKLTSDVVLNRVFRISTDYRQLNFRRREDERRIPGSIDVGLKHGISLRPGVLTDTALNGFLNETFLRYGGDRNFNSLPIPLRCVATDIGKGELHIFRKGSIADAVRASISLPAVFPPFVKDDHVYVDGAILENLPTETVISEFHPQAIIAVSIPLGRESKAEQASIFGVLTRSFSVASWANEQRSRKLADVVIEPDVNGLTTGDYTKALELGKHGYEAAEKKRAELLRYRVSDAEWEQYLSRRRSLLPPEPGTIRHVAVTGPTPALQRAIQKEAELMQGQPLTAQVINKELEQIRSDGRFVAGYSVGDPAAAGGASVKIDVQDKVTGPPFLQLGVNILAQTGQGARATLDGNFLYQDLGGYGSEFRVRFSAGFTNGADVEYFRKLSSRGYFIAPRIEFQRMPVYIYDGTQSRVAERLHQKVGGAIDFGQTRGESREIRVGWSEFQHRWITTTGTDGSPDLSGSAQLVRGLYRVDMQDRALIPQHGFGAEVNAGYLYNAVHSENAPRITAKMSYVFPWGGNVFMLAGEGGTMFNRRIADPFLFELGGPLRLSASLIGEYRGTDYWVARPMYMRRVFHLPQPLGQSIYAMATYNIGEMHSPMGNSVRRQDVFFGILAETPLGVVSFGPAIGSDDHRKLVFTLGRFF
ncbi:MAG: patatin-like phospholipase family protein [Acidobacteria bacterium]|nr:patatin-like phospholipase family protein [Acidobacteriota bacterium]